MPRHGNRLDAADKKWHLSSSAPYDPPLTYGGFQQARQVGSQISSILEQAKFDADKLASRNGSTKRKRFRVVIHSSPFLRCVQTSVGISAGLAQVSPDSYYKPSDLIVPVAASPGKADTAYRTAILRLDSYLGEWQSPEYYESITPPPPSSLMIGTAKADLFKREDYGMYAELPPTTHQQPPPRKSSLWSGSSSPSASSLGFDVASPFGTSALSSALSGMLDERMGYMPPRPTFAISGAGKIPDGFVAHARDECLTVDFQWDSARTPYDFGDGGSLPEEWTTMHKRFRRGVKRMLNWYATTESPTELVSACARPQAKPKHARANAATDDDDDIETVVIIVSHGAGCNALIGAITHQPVLMDVGIASITLGTRKDDLDYNKEYHNADARDSLGKPLVHVDHMYEIRISASTDHLRAASSTPVSARSSSNSIWSPTGRGRTSTIGTSTPPSQSSISVHDNFSNSTSRSSSISYTIGSLGRRDSASKRTGSRVAAMAPAGLFSSSGSSSGNAGGPTLSTASQSGLWRPSPAPSSLRLMDDGTCDDEKENDGFPNFDQSRLSQNYSTAKPRTSTIGFIDEEEDPTPKRLSNGPLLAAPIKIRTSWGDKESQKERKAPQEVTITHQIGDGMGGLWGVPSSVGEAECLRDMTQPKRRWTVTEKSR